MSENEGKILPGIKPALELLAREPWRIAKIYCKKNMAPTNARKLICLCRKGGVRLEMADACHLDEICARGASDRRISHQGVITILSEASFITLSALLMQAATAPLPLIVALDQVKDPGNAGAICRTAYALGCAGLLLPKHNSASLGAAAARSSAGALARLPICEAANLARALDDAEAADFAIYGASTHADSLNAFAMQWRLPAILALGGEKAGIRPGVAKRCQHMIKIPFLRQFDSLNVAQAGGILISLCARQHLGQLS